MTAGSHGGGRSIRPPRPYRYTDARSLPAPEAGPVVPAPSSGAATLAPRYSRSAARVLMDEGWEECTRDRSSGDKFVRGLPHGADTPTNVHGRDKPGHGQGWSVNPLPLTAQARTSEANPRAQRPVPLPQRLARAPFEGRGERKVRRTGGAGISFCGPSPHLPRTKWREPEIN
mgnify:CR=1 FL=1